jgi:hypothetical protein
MKHISCYASFDGRDVTACPLTSFSLGKCKIFDSWKSSSDYDATAVEINLVREKKTIVQRHIGKK